MRTEPFEIYLPCDVLAVKVTVGPAERLSVLEELALKAVHAGVDSFDQLDRLFGLGPRPTLDLVYDLWRQGHLVVDFATGVLELTPPALAAAAANAWGPLSGGERTDGEREVMLDLITGQVLELGRLRAPPSGGGAYVVPAGPFGVGPADVKQADLLDVLTRIIARESDSARSAGGRPRRILAAGLSLAEGGPARGRLFLPVEVNAYIDNATDGLEIRVVNGAGLPPAARDRLRQRVGQLDDDTPESDFIRAVRGRAERKSQPAPDVGELLSKLSEKLDGLSAINRGLVSGRHAELAGLADPLDELCSDLSAASATAALVAGQAAHSAAVKRMIDGADQQLVLVCPWVRYESLREFLPGIERALARGVQIFLLWGIRPGDYDTQAGSPDLRPDCYSALAGLRSRFPHRLFFSRRSARTHAKVVVRDDREVLVSSLNFLDPSTEGVLEIGVTASAADRRAGADPPPPLSAAERVLEWAWRRFPEHDPGRLMLTDREQFGPTALPAYPAASLRPPRPTAVAGEGPGAAIREEIAAAVVRLWAESWAAYARLAAGCATPAGARAVPAINGDNRAALWAALRTATSRLLIASDQIGPEVVSEGFARAIEERLQAGAVVSLVYRRASASSLATGVDPVKRLEEVASRYPGRCRIVRADTHAKVLVADNAATIGSFNFLSFEGSYDEMSRFRQRSEVSLTLTGGDVADQVVQALGGTIPDAVSGWPTTSSHSTPLPAPFRTWAPESDQSLMTDLTQAAADAAAAFTDPARADEAAAAAAAELLLTATRTADAPWPLLDRLRRANLPTRLMRRSVAATLATQPPPDGERPSWLGWLLSDAWGRSRFIEAAVIGVCCPEPWPENLPHPLVVRVAGARSAGTIGQGLWDDALLADLSSGPARTALAAAAVAEVASRADPGAVEAMADLSPSLPAAWGRVARAVDGYWQQTGAPLPSDGLDRHAAVQAAWARLRDSCGRAAAKHFRFPIGAKTHHHLFDPGGAFARLGGAAEDEDVAAVADWLKAEPVDRIGDYLDSATRAAAGRGGLIGPPVRESYITLLTAVVRAAQEVVAAAVASGGEEALRRAERARAVARAVHRDWDNLWAEATGVEPERVLMRAILTEWRDLAEWGAT